MRAFWMVLLLAGPAIAQPRGTPHKEGEYGGVVPGQASKPDGKPAKPKKAPPKGTLTWVGFEAKDGGAQVFLQSVAPFEVTQRLEGSTLVVSLSLSRLGTNTWRQVDTRFFDNPLSMIKAGKKKRSIDVRIAFKNPKDAKPASVRTATEADGMYYAYLSFPEGTPDDSANRPAVSDDVGD